MFSKSLFSSLCLLVLASSAFGAPALSCPAPSTVTVSSVAAASSSIAAAAPSAVTDIATSVASSAASSKAASSVASSAAAATSTAKGAAAAAKFGSCESPEIKFAANLDGRKETSFVPANLRSFNHGSADNISVISSFICQQLKNKCRANAAALADCTAGTSAANAAAPGTGAQADAFNAAFGIKTNFASVAAVGTNGKTVGSKASSTSGASSAASSTAAVLAASSSVADASSTVTNVAVASSTTGSGSADAEQSATVLDPAVIATGFEQDGQATPAAGQVASLTSSNNFINFCLTVNKPITNGQQIKTGSCNPAPMGVIAANTNIPSCKFTSPSNFGTVKANAPFTITMAINNLDTGNFVNADTNYFAAPQEVNSAGDIIGHSHVVIETLDSLNQTTTTDPTKFAFFKGINGAAVNGVLSVDVGSPGLPAGSYRMASINSAANHQPVLVAVAQHGSHSVFDIGRALSDRFLDDMQVENPRAKQALHAARTRSTTVTAEKDYTAGSSSSASAHRAPAARSHQNLRAMHASSGSGSAVSSRTASASNANAMGISPTSVGSGSSPSSQSSRSRSGSAARYLSVNTQAAAGAIPAVPQLPTSANAHSGEARDGDALTPTVASPAAVPTRDIGGAGRVQRSSNGHQSRDRSLTHKSSSRTVGGSGTSSANSGTRKTSSASTARPAGSGTKDTSRTREREKRNRDKDKDKDRDARAGDVDDEEHDGYRRAPRMHLHDAEPAPPTLMYWSRAPVWGVLPTHKMRSHSATVVDNTTIWLFGGCDDKEFWRDVLCLDVETMEWTRPETIGEVPPPCRAHTATLVDRRLFVFGGGQGNMYYNTLYVLDTTSRRWTHISFSANSSSASSSISTSNTNHSHSLSGTTSSMANASPSAVSAATGEPSTTDCEDETV
ncbi:hypothetical protein EW145_g6334, partial [Phellinidium pouzarii]